MRSSSLFRSIAMGDRLVLVDATEFARALPVLKRPAFRADVVVPLFRVPVADAANVTMVVGERAVARRTHQLRWRCRRIYGHETCVRLRARRTTPFVRTSDDHAGAPRLPGRVFSDGRQVS